MAASGSEQRHGSRVDRTLDAVIDAGIRRWGTLGIPAGAAVAIIFGAGFLLAPDRYAPAPFYAYAFQLLSMGPRPIGVVHLVLGVAVLVWPSRPTVVGLIALNAVWAIISVAAVFQPAVSPTSFAYPLVFCLLIFLSVRARGYDHASRR